jgi:hypothetical protein
MSLLTTMTINGIQYLYFETIDGDKRVYHGANHDDTTRQTLEFIRTAPKRSGVNYGVRRGYIRFTEDRPCTNTDDSVVIQPTVSTASINWPVGVTDPDTVIEQELGKVLGGLTSGVVPDCSFEQGGTAFNVGSEFAQIVAFFKEGSL